MFSLESPHRGDSNDNTNDIFFNIKKNVTLNYSKSAAVGFSKELKNEFETAVVNKPSVFEPLEVNCIYVGCSHLLSRWIDMISKKLTLYLFYSSKKSVAR